MHSFYRLNTTNLQSISSSTKLAYLKLVLLMYMMFLIRPASLQFLKTQSPTSIVHFHDGDVFVSVYLHHLGTEPWMTKPAPVPFRPSVSASAPVHWVFSILLLVGLQ